jgi:broad specificity phosphatase PhoE
MSDVSHLNGPTLILIKHALPDIDPARPAQEWRLGDTGRSQAEELAERLRPYAPQRVITSREPKASETGQILASILDLPCSQVQGLHEQERLNESYTDTATFRSKIQLLFLEPDSLHFGTETASEAQHRFSAAIETILNNYSESIIAVVAHGTVISLYAAPLLNRDAFELWQSLECGDFVVIR